jgi:hypothetical protein
MMIGFEHLNRDLKLIKDGYELSLGGNDRIKVTHIAHIGNLLMFCFYCSRQNKNNVPFSVLSDKLMLISLCVGDMKSNLLLLNLKVLVLAYF